jgi:short-subunit dehydrogenase
MNLKEKVIVITGASAGIGKATALAAGKSGAHVVLAARRIERLIEIAERIEAAGGKALTLTVDVSNEMQVRNMIDSAVERFGRIDVLINNAGAGLQATVEETTPEQMERLWRVNYMGTFYGIRSVLPVMKNQGNGQIITIASMSGKRGAKLKSAYCATKFAQIGLVESLRMELMGTNIKCTLIFPGATESEFLEAMENPGGREKKFYGTIQKAEQVADAILNSIGDSKPEIITQKLGRLQLLVQAFSPSLADWLASRRKRL